MQKKNKVRIAYSVAFTIVVAITLFAFVTSNKLVKEIIAENPAINLPEKLNWELENTKAEKIGITPQEYGNLSMRSAVALKPSITVDQLNQPICPPSLEVEYFIDYKKTQPTKDDEAYIRIINNKPQIERIGVTIDGTYEGLIEVRSLGTSAMKSSAITSWWNSLTAIASKTFLIELMPERCQMEDSQVAVNYPPSETDYKD